MKNTPRGRVALVFTLLAVASVAAVTVRPTSAAEQEVHVGPSVRPDDLGMRLLPRALAGRIGGLGTSALSGSPGADVALGGWNETTIAVNPTDPMNIAYASLLELRVTTDGGATWQPPVPLRVPPTHVAQGDPCLAFDSAGRLFCSYLGSPSVEFVLTSGIDIFFAQCDPATGAILPGYPVNVTEQIGIGGLAGNRNDKPWLAADSDAGSPYADRLYLAWTKFPPTNQEVTIASHSSDHGLTWSPPLLLGDPDSTPLIWPAMITVGPGGDVYAADHRQPGFSGGAPNGVSGFVTVYRSTDGGTTFPQHSQAFTAGYADMTTNVQTSVGAIPGARFLLQGSFQPWVLPDPTMPGRVFVVSNDDPDNDVTSGDPANVYLATSTDYGVTWGAPMRVDSGPGNSLQVMPSASIDPVTGAIVVHYYDDRSGAVNTDGNFLLDVYAAVSVDGGATFMPDFKVSDEPFDPDAGARCRWDCGTQIIDVWDAGGGEAFAVTAGGDFLHYAAGVWTTVTSTGGPMPAVWGSSDTDVFACGLGGQIFHWDGVQLVAQTSNTTKDLLDLDGTSSTDVYAVGTAGTVLHYDGANWLQLPIPTLQDLHVVWVSPTGAVYAAGRNGAVFRWDGSWTDLSIGGSEILFSIWGSSESDVYVTTAEGLLEHWNGSAWSEVSDLQEAALGDVWGTSASNVLALGVGRLWRYDGSTWTDEAVSEHQLWRAHGSGPGDIFAVGEDGEIDHFDGSGWTRQTNPLSPVNPTLRIGEYNGEATVAGKTFTVWCGNMPSGNAPLDQQAFFDAFYSDWQVGVSLADVLHPVKELSLEAPWPNPARRSLTVAYSLPRAANVDVSLVDLAGRRVATLIHGSQSAGRHVTSWDRRATHDLSAGVYVLKLSDGREKLARKVALVPVGAAD